MKKITLISFLFFLIAVAALYLFFFQPSSPNSIKEPSDAQKLFEQINNFDLVKLDNLLNKFSAMKQHGKVPVKKAEEIGTKNPFAPF